MIRRILLLSFFLSASFVSHAAPLYLDAAAAYPPQEKSLIAFLDVAKLSGNSSGLNAHAKRLKALENAATLQIAKSLHAKNSEILHEGILFTNSATVANNIAILGVAYRYPGAHLITSKIEHKSVLNIFKYLETQGYTVTYLDVDAAGRINPADLEKAITPKTKLVSIQWQNSEIGTIQDIPALVKIAKAHGIIFHSDAAQAFLKE